MTAVPEIVTFGCRLNTYESEVMRQHAAAAGLGEAVIFNTCAVTAEAERQALQSIRKHRREHPAAKIIVTGCAAQIDPQKFAALAEVDHVIGNDAKLQAEVWAALFQNEKKPENNPEPNSSPLAGEARRGGVPQTEALISTPAPSKIHVPDIQAVRESTAPLVHGFEGKWRGFVQVQNGCDHRCTFCVIPFGRGPSRSVPMGVVAEQVRALVAQGYNEIAFTGVDITAYGADLPGQPSLGQMIRRVLAQVPELKRLRLSSLDPVEVDEELWRLVATEPRLMPHLHLSLQSGDDLVLKRMKRRHNSADLVAFCEKARRLRPDIVFGADVIAGFPTEDETMAANTLRLVEQLDITWLHVFPYSARRGTPAAKMPQLRGDIRKARAAQLREAGRRAVLRHLDNLVGQTLDVLVEQSGVGRTATFAEVAIPHNAPVGAIIPATCAAHDGARLIANTQQDTHSHD